MIGLQFYFKKTTEKKPVIQPKEDIQVDTIEDKEHEIILYNDDINTFTHVIETLIRVCEHHPQQAEQCALLVHYTGKCVVKTGPYNDLEPRCQALLDAGLSAEIV
ncbi:MAG: ATP-dependent Clp protease adaptor ClpS [Flavobacteriaceae bacterium]